MVWFLLFELSCRDHRGLMAPQTKPPQSGAKRTGQAKGRRLPRAESGLGSLSGPGGGFKRALKKAVGADGSDGGRKPACLTSKKRRTDEGSGHLGMAGRKAKGTAGPHQLGCKEGAVGDLPNCPQGHAKIICCTRFDGMNLSSR